MPVESNNLYISVHVFDRKLFNVGFSSKSAVSLQIPFQSTHTWSSKEFPCMGGSLFRLMPLMWFKVTPS